MNTQQATMTIASAALVEAHPELHHYTTLSGLKGIFESRSIWATHYRDLNDASEVRLLQEPLTAALEGHFGELLRSQQRDSLRIRRAIQKLGGLFPVARGVSESMVRSLYLTTFDDKSQFGLEPFVASFCTHAGPELAYERENGLLSQWRGYGGEGGYCLVFDTQRLSKLMGSEFDSYYYVHLNIDAVRYALTDTSIAQLFPELLARSEQFLTAILEQRDPIAVSEDGFGPFVSGATLYKHQGFREECEVRVVAMPGSEQLQEEIHRENPELKRMPIKAVYKNNGRRHISLLDTIKKELPIKRIIVGPSRNQHENLRRAEGTVPDRIPLKSSDTPYIG